MNHSLSEYMAKLMEHLGCAVAQNNEEYIEVLSSQKVMSLIGLPEYSRLCFIPEKYNPITSKSSWDNDVILVDFDSEIFNSVPKLLGDKGRFAEMNYPPAEIKPEKFENKVLKNIVLKNAVFNPGKSETKNISYLLSYFKWSAVSDEKHEGIMANLINEYNLICESFTGDIEDIISKKSDAELMEIERKDIAVITNSLLSAQKKQVTDKLMDFKESLIRRLNRDISRVNEYYYTLIKEIKETLTKKILLPEDNEKYQNKIKSIEMELKLKTQDLIDKYSLNISIEPVSIIRINTPVQILWLEIKRRKNTRQFPVTFNSILMDIDGLPCEGCFTKDRSYYICDEQLHILCNQCFSPCEKCGKNYCHACHKNGCPKCKR